MGASLVQVFPANQRSGKQATTSIRTLSSLPWSAQRPPRSCESARAFLQQAPQRRDRSRSGEPDHHAGDGGLALVPSTEPEDRQLRDGPDRSGPRADICRITRTTW